MAKKKRAATPAIAENIFDHFEGRGGSFGSSQEPAPKGDGEAALLERIAKLETSLDDANRRAMTVTHVPVQQTHQVDPAKLTLDLKDLPDVVDKPADFQAELARRVNAVIEGRVHAVRQEVADSSEQGAAADRLWNGFAAAHPEWADYPQLVGVVAKQVVEDATSKGIDPQKYVLGNPETYFSDVNKALRKQYGALAKGKEEGEEEAEGTPEGDEDTGRTGGIFGGADAGSRPAPKGPPPGDMIKDLQMVQQRMGLV